MDWKCSNLLLNGSVTCAITPLLLSSISTSLYWVTNCSSSVRTWDWKAQQIFSKWSTGTCVIARCACATSALSTQTSRKRARHARSGSMSAGARLTRGLVHTKGKPVRRTRRRHSEGWGQECTKTSKKGIPNQNVIFRLVKNKNVRDKKTNKIRNKAPHKKKKKLSSSFPMLSMRWFSKIRKNGTKENKKFN